MGDAHVRDLIYLQVEARRLRHEREGRRATFKTADAAKARERLLDRVALYVARLEELSQ